jgi:hypothetical protein
MIESKMPPKELWVERKRGQSDTVWTDTSRIKGRSKTSTIRHYVRFDEHILRLGTQLGPLEDKIKKLQAQIKDYEAVLETAAASHDAHIAELAAHILGRLV